MAAPAQRAPTMTTSQSRDGADLVVIVCRRERATSPLSVRLIECWRLCRRASEGDKISMTNMSSDIVQVWPGGIPRVGQIAERSRTVNVTDIERFTEISGDRNPLHYDEAAAKASRFGEIVVQGGVTSAILNAVVAEDLPGPGTVFLHVNWSFKAPVRPGDTITGRAEVLEVRTDKPITKLKTSVVRDDGTLVLEGDAVCYTMPIARRPPI